MFRSRYFKRKMLSALSCRSFKAALKCSSARQGCGYNWVLWVGCSNTIVQRLRGRLKAENNIGWDRYLGGRGTPADAFSASPKECKTILQVDVHSANLCQVPNQVNAHCSGSIRLGRGEGRAPHQRRYSGQHTVLSRRLHREPNFRIRKKSLFSPLSQNLLNSFL